MTKQRLPTLTFEEIIEVLEEELEKYNNDSVFEELDFDAACNKEY